LPCKKVKRAVSSPYGAEKASTGTANLTKNSLSHGLGAIFWLHELAYEWLERGAADAVPFYNRDFERRLA
jgi:hypothetical protein